MNWDSIVITSAGISWASALIAGTYYILTTSLFDIKQAAANKKAKKHPSMVCFRRNPNVSIILLSKNDEKSIVQTLNSIKHIGYRKYEVVVVDNDSKDRTKHVVKDYIKTNRRKNIKLLTIKSSNHTQTLKVCLSQAKGELLIFGDADSVYDKNNLKHAVTYIQVNSASQWAASIRPISHQTLKSLTKSINYSIFTLPLLKLYSLKGISRVESAILYKKDMVTGGLSVPSNSKTIKSFTIKSFAIIFSALKASWFALFAYLSYIAIAHNYALPLGLFLGSVMVYSIIMINSDSDSTLKSKSVAMLSLPGSLMVLYFSTIFSAAKKTYTTITNSILAVKVLKKA